MPAWEVSTPLSVEAALQRLNAALAQLEEAAELNHGVKMHTRSSDQIEQTLFSDAPRLAIRQR